MNFSLWHDPWIDVIGADGTLHRLGIAACLAQAHQLRAIAAPSPLSSIGIQRFLIAIVQDMTRPASVDDVAHLLAGGAFVSRQLDAFATAHAKRFDLFDPQAPFLQRGGDLDDIISSFKKRPQDQKAAAALFVEIPSGSRRAWWRRHYEDQYLVCPACAAAGILALFACSTDFGKGNRATITSGNACYVFPAGVTLFDTLARSVLAPEYQSPTAHGDHESAPWTWDDDAIRLQKCTRVGYLESLVFPSRVIRLIPQAHDGTCSRCGQETTVAIGRISMTQGWYYRSEESWVDPFVAYNRTSKGRLMPVRADSTTASWPQYSTLVLGNQAASQRPLVVDQLALLVQQGAIPCRAMTARRCAGLDSKKQANYRSWIDEALPVPPVLFDDPERAAHIAIVIGLTQSAALVVDRVLKTNDFLDLDERNQVTHQFWNELGDSFQHMLGKVDAGDDDALDQWAEEMLETASTRGDAALGALDGAAPLQAARARQSLRRGLGGIRKQWRTRSQAPAAETTQGGPMFLFSKKGRHHIFPLC